MRSSLQYGLAGLIALVLGAILALLIPRTEFATSVIELLPGQDTEVEILRELAEQEQGRVLNVLLETDSSPVSQAAQRAFLKSLQQTPEIETAWVAGKDALREAGRILFENRYTWLLPAWLDRHFPDWEAGNGPDGETLAREVADNLDRYLNSPDGMALVETIPEDPFLLTELVLDSAGELSPVLGGNRTMLWVRQSASPFREEGQEPVFAALEAAHDRARAVQPEIRMEYSGVAVFAQASKERIKAEIGRLNTMGLLLVLAVTLFWVRSIQPVTRILLVVLLALLAAATTVIAVFPSVHVISLVIGSILTGIAVDYGFHLILNERQGLPPAIVKRAVITGSVSSALGFIVLVWAPLPFLRQVGVFVGAGLLAALLVALLLRQDAANTPEIRAGQVNPFSLPRWTGPLLLLLFLPGLHQVSWKDSINDLEYPLPEIKARDERLNRLTSPATEKSVYLAVGDDLVQARDRLERALGKADQLQHAGQWIPTLEKCRRARERMAALPAFGDRLSAELEQRDYLPEAFAPFFEAWESYRTRPVETATYQQPLQHLADSLPGPLANLIHGGEGLAWFMVLAPESVQLPELEGLLPLNQNRMFSRAFGLYRSTMLSFAGICLVVLSAGVLLVYGPRKGAGALALPLLAILLTYGLSGYTGTNLTLFHIVGTLLAFCMALDYALFAVESHAHWHRMPGSVSISGVTTMGVFGILATSRIPAIEQLAATVLFIMAAVLLLILAGWPWLRRGAVAGRFQFRQLPHGEAALYVDRVLSGGEKHIRVACRHSSGGLNGEEWILEAMAQAAAVLLAHTRGQAGQRRSGMLVVVQDCSVLRVLDAAETTLVANVESMTDQEEGLLMFKGECRDQSDTLYLRAAFSIFIPPEEQKP